jgi:hypothetical protein
MEDTKISLHKWLLAIHLMCSSKKGISSLQLHRMLGLARRSGGGYSGSSHEAVV